MASKSFDIHDMHLQPMWFKLLLAVLIIVVILGAAYLYKYREQLEELEIKRKLYYILMNYGLNIFKIKVKFMMLYI